MSDRVRTGTLGLFLLVVLVAAGGCGGSSLVGRHYDNFTAYYNTFYNARQAFDEGVRTLERTDEAVDRRYYIDVFIAPVRGSSNERFQDAIDKSADVLRAHPDSKWVDDALLLIGQSYFYQQNFVGAEQKFREVIALGTVLEDESRLWLARTLIAAGSLDEARDHLVASLAQEDLSDRWAPLIHLALGELYVKQEEFEAAAEELESGIEEVRDNELEARGSFLLGQVLETLGRYEDAVEAYRRVARAHPPYELSYAANISAVRVQGLHVEADEAQRELRRMQRDDKNYSNRLELAYLLGQIYQSQGRSEAALNQYRNILYDSDGQLGDLRGRIHYALGELARTVDEDYVVASAHYDTARTSLSSSAPAGSDQEQYTPEAIVDAEDKAEMFATFATVRGEIARMDSLLILGSLNPEEFADRIMEIRRQKARELSEQQRLVEQRQAERGFQDAAARAGDPGRNEVTDPSGTAGFLFHRDPVRVQESRMNFITQWGDRPLTPNWRRSEAIATASSSGEFIDDAAARRVLDRGAEGAQEALPVVDYSDVPRDSLSRAAMLAQRALARYELGNVLFLSMNRPDSAATWYRMVIEEDGAEDVAQRAYYALAEVQRSLGDSAAARSIYEQVLRDFPDSDFAGRVREQLGIQQDAPSDSLAIASEEYDRAFERWRRGAHDQALNDMVSVAAHHRRTEVAPKALLAAGRIYLEWAEKDSLDIFGPLPLNVADSLIGEAGLRGSPDEQDSPRISSSRVDPTNPAVDDELANAGQSVGAPSSSPTEDMPSENGLAESRQSAEGDEQSVEELKAAERGAVDDRPASPRRRISDEDPSIAAGDDVPALRRMNDGSPPPGAGTPDSSGSVPVTAAAATESDGSQPPPLIAVGVLPSSAERQTGAADSLADGSGALLATAGEDDVYLRTLYASIKSRYPSTPYANQADEMLAALESFRAELEAAAVAAEMESDSTAFAEEDSVGIETSDLLANASEDSLAVPRPDSLGGAMSDSLGQAVLDESADSLASVAADSLSTAADSLADAAASESFGESTEVVEAVTGDSASAKPSTQQEASQGIPTGDESLKGSGGIAEELGGYTLVLGMNVVREPMETLAARYAEQGFRTDVVAEQVGSTTVYRAALGHFPTMQMARRALEQNRSSLEGGVQVAPLGPPSSPR